ncbi:cytochrome p450 [Rhyzopertha dominica]|nr:cytochrome p450 [Rhyzopertha dominica]
MSLTLSLLLTCLTLILFSLYLFFKCSYSYWKNRRVPYIRPTIPFGNLQPPWAQRDIFGNTIREWHNEFRKDGHKYGGVYVFAAPALVLLDPDLIRRILIKDFQYFTDQGVYYNEKDEPLSGHLLNIEGPRWKEIRTKLSPTFTSGKMRAMFPALVKYSRQIEEVLDGCLSLKKPLDFKDTFMRYTTDVVSSLAFGVEGNCFKERNPEIIKYGRMVFESDEIGELMGVFGNTYPKLARALGIKVYAPGVEKYFTDMIRAAINYRESNAGNWVDLMQLMIELKNGQHQLKTEEIVSNAFVFFQGYETSAATGTFCLYEICKNHVIQDRMREEILEVLNRHGGELTYEAMKEMKYMQQVVNETLRKYPPFQFLTRQCTKDYKMPDDSGLVVEKGTKIFISNLGLQYDPSYFTDPEKFDPDRFSEENLGSLVPYTNLPFGEGPRICIGMRFASMQTIVGLTAFLRNYRFTLNEKTVDPIIMDPSCLTLNITGGLWLNVERLSEVI